ncbi:MAG: glycosyltransferase family 2 protein [Acetobacteraceae bacterium]
MNTDRTDDAVTAPTISAIIPLHNGARYIEQALTSVFRQTLRPHEVIVVDDGSSDNGPELVEKLRRDHGVTIMTQSNQGQSAARNLGIRHATGSHIALLDQDDIWYPNHLQVLIEPFQGHRYPPLGWSYGNFDEIDSDGRLTVRSALDAHKTPHPKPSLACCLREDMLVLPSASLIASDAFDAVGGFDETLSGYEDDDLFLRLFHAGYDNAYVRQSLGQRRIYPDSSCYSPRMAPSRMAFARKLLAQFPDDAEQARYYTRDLIAPRFLPHVTNEARKALRSEDPQLIRERMDDVQLLRNHIGDNAIRHGALISVVIALYNGGPFIEEALRSVAAQTLQPDEVIVVDDGSTDDGPDIVRAFAARYPVRLLRKPNGGQSSARNFGVADAHGDLIAFLDQDDVWYPNHLQVLAEPFAKRRAVALGWVYSNLDRIDRDGNMVMHAFLRVFPTQHPKTNIQDCLRQDMFILPSAALVARTAFDKVGGFDERLSGYEDDDLFLRIFRAGYQNVYINVALSQWRIYTGSTSYTPRMSRSRIVYIRKLAETFPDNEGQEQFFMRDFVAPRFLPTMMRDLRLALASGDPQSVRTAVHNLEFIARHLRRRYRVIILAIAPWLHIRPLARLALMMKDVAPQSLRRLLFAVR